MKIKLFVDDRKLIEIYKKEGISSDFLKMLAGLYPNEFSYDKNNIKDLEVQDMTFRDFATLANLELDSDRHILYIEHVPVKIELNHAVVDDDKIYISSDSSIYIELHNHNEIDIDSLLSKYNEIIKNGKKNGIKFSYRNHYKRFLMDKGNRALYKKSLDNFHSLYNELKKQWIKKIAKGLYYGLAYDEEYNQLSNLYSKAQKFSYGSSMISMIENIVCYIDKYYKEIVTEDCKYLDYDIICL